MSLIDFIYISFIAASVITGLLLVKKASPVWNKALVFFLMVTLFNEVLCYFLKKRAVNTIAFYNCYSYFRFPMLAWIYFDVLKKQRIQRPVFVSFLVLTVLLFIFNLFFYKSFFVLHSSYFLAGGIYVIILSLIYTYSLMDKDSLQNPLREPFFWISSGFLLYFLGALPFIGAIKLLTKYNTVLASQQLIITKSMSIVLYSLITIGFVLQWKKKNYSY